MRIALVHDYLKEYGGAERVLEVLHELFPKAPLYTIVYLPSFLGPHKIRFVNWNIKPSGAQLLPFKQKLISPLRLLAPIFFKSFDFSSYDLIIVSATGAYNPNIIDKKNAKLICYYHTPPRYLYGYPTARKLSNNKVIKSLTVLANHFLRLIDFKSSQNVDMFIANSYEVKGRIAKFYRKDAVVVYPPVDLPHVKLKSKKENFFVAGGRLAMPKNIHIIIDACTKLNLPLKVFGKSFAGYGETLKKIAGSNVEFLGEISDEQKWDLLSKGRAFIFASADEDFGIVPVEAMGAGIPVIAYRSGGVMESVIEGQTGMFFDKPDAASLMETLVEFEKKKFSALKCRAQAEKFSKQIFKNKILKIVDEVVAKNNV